MLKGIISCNYNLILGRIFLVFVGIIFLPLLFFMSKLTGCFSNTTYISWGILEKKNTCSNPQCFMYAWSSGAFSKAFFFWLKFLKVSNGLHPEIIPICVSDVLPSMALQTGAGWLLGDSQHDDVPLTSCKEGTLLLLWVYLLNRKMP